MVDHHRRTGRTTRMMHELIGYLTVHPDRDVLLVCHSRKYARQVLCEHVPFSLQPRVDIASPNTLHERAVRADEPRACFVDHNAYRGWAWDPDSSAAVDRMAADDESVRRGA
jgi:hypothetical protein